MSRPFAIAQSLSIPGDVAANVERHLRFARRAAERNACFLLFPELSLTGYDRRLARELRLSPDAPVLAPLRSLAQEASMTIVAGLPATAPLDRTWIAAAVFHPDGSTSLHTKKNLHPGEEEFFVAGQGGEILEVEEDGVALGICADLSHPGHAAAAADAGATIYAVGALISDKGYAADAEKLAARAKDNEMAVLFANHSGTSGGYLSAGQSGMWDEEGELAIVAPDNAEWLLLCSYEEGLWGGKLISIGE